jgi:hypothetical protein
VTVVVLGAKALLAVMLLVAGGAKLAGLEAFAATVLLLAPRRRPLPRALSRRWPAGPALAVLRSWAPGSKAGARRVARTVALGEIALGGASLAVPAAPWLNLAVLAAAAGFVAVSAAGYAFHRGRSCRCFGALSQRRFDRAGLARSAAVAALAGLATVAVPPAPGALPPRSRPDTRAPRPGMAP